MAHVKNPTTAKEVQDRMKQAQQQLAYPCANKMMYQMGKSTKGLLLIPKYYG